MRTIVLLILVLLAGGCQETFNSSEGKSKLVKAEYRAIISAKRAVIGSHGQPVLDRHGNPVTSLAVCAEPSPDALLSTAQALSVQAPEAVAKALLSYGESESTTYIGLRTQTIQLLRDAYFRLCEAFLNDGIDAIAYDVLQRRFQSQIVALLAVEQLTSLGRRFVAGNEASELAQVTKALEESEDALLTLKGKKNRAGKTSPSSTPRKKDDAGAEPETVKQSQEVLEEQIARRLTMIEVLKESFIKATQASSTLQPPGGPVPDGLHASGIADAVRAITLNAINQDYESQVCFETLRYHNHAGQFRNDTNHAFDSVGLHTGLKGQTFLNHCESLFASQVAFRNARVSVVEAYASAIAKVTNTITNNNNISVEKVKAAAKYVSALADTIPTEPGTAFLRRGTD